MTALYENQYLQNAVRILAAYVLALPVAWDRERSERSAGLRTFPLVAIASCGFLLIIVRQDDFTAESVSRVIQGLMTGIGFIGGGAILKKPGEGIHGTATAASIWGTAAIGAATGLGQYEIAVLLSVMTFATLRFLKPLKRSIDADRDGSREP